MTPAGSSLRWMLSLVAICLLVAAPAHARDDLDTWSRQIRGDPEFKVRLSAGLKLGQLGDPRAVPALTEALGDDIATVRTIAASALGKVVSAEVPASDRARALAALRRQMQSDANSGARRAAKSAVGAFERVERIAKPRPTKNGVFVQVEPMTDSTRSLDSATLAKLTTIGRESLMAANEVVLVDWPGGRSPSRKQLKKAKARAIVVMASLREMNVTTKGKRAEVECKLNLILASYPQKAARTFVDGKAKLDTNNKPKSIERAKSRCAMDIVKHLMGSRLARDVSTTAR